MIYNFATLMYDIGNMDDLSTSDSGDSLPSLPDLHYPDLGYTSDPVANKQALLSVRILKLSLHIYIYIYIYVM